MSKVYLVASIYEEKYFNTSKEADRERPGGEYPESINRLDAATECNRLAEENKKWEKNFNSLRMILENLVDISSHDTLQTQAGQKAVKFIEDHSLPPATAAYRDGARSYGGG